MLFLLAYTINARGKGLELGLELGLGFSQVTLTH